jgi:hypothetical protein
MTACRKTGPSLCSSFVALIGCIFALAPFAGAQQQGQKASHSTEQVNVVGHVELPRMQISQIVLQQRGDKHFLFLRRADKNDFAIVNVTDASHPAVVDRNALQETAGSNVNLPAEGSVFGVAFIPDRSAGSSAAAPALPTESVRLLDLTDPQHPKTMKTFDGVTAVASDDSRKLLFVVNSEGLWIVRHHREHPLPLCTSDSESAPMPECR